MIAGGPFIVCDMYFTLTRQVFIRSSERSRLYTCRGRTLRQGEDNLTNVSSSTSGLLGGCFCRSLFRTPRWTLTLCSFQDQGVCV